MKKQYFDMLQEEYNKPPKEVVKLLNKVLKKVKHKIFTIKINHKLISAVTILFGGKGIFMIHELVTRKNFRNRGYATKLMQLVHSKYKGIFLVRTTTAKKFYKNLGYIPINDRILAYVNDENIFNRRYW